MRSACISRQSGSPAGSNGPRHASVPGTNPSSRSDRACVSNSERLMTPPKSRTRACAGIVCSTLARDDTFFGDPGVEDLQRRLRKRIVVDVRVDLDEPRVRADALAPVSYTHLTLP